MGGSADDSDTGDSDPDCDSTQNPVSIAWGDKQLTATDLIVPLPGRDFRLERYYTSRASTNSTGMAGSQWEYNFNAWVNLKSVPGASYYALDVYPDGRSKHTMWGSHLATEGGIYISSSGFVNDTSTYAMEFRTSGPSTQVAKRNVILADWPHYPVFGIGPDDDPELAVDWNLPVITVMEPGLWEKHFHRGELGGLADPGTVGGYEAPYTELPNPNQGLITDLGTLGTGLLGRLVEERDPHGNRWVYRYDDGTDYDDNKIRVEAIHCIDRNDGELNALIEFDWVTDESPLNGLLRSVKVLRPDPLRLLIGDDSTQEVQRVEYYYFLDFGASEITEDSGQGRDLVEVRYYERVDEGPIPTSYSVDYPARLLINQYRYHRAGDPVSPDATPGDTASTTIYVDEMPGGGELELQAGDGVGGDHQLKMVIPSRHIENFAGEIASSSVDMISVANDIRAQDDTEALPPFTSGDEWSPSLLASKIIPLYQSDTLGGRVLAQLVRTGCGCSGTGKLITYEYRDYDQTDPDSVYSRTTVVREYVTSPPSYGVSELLPFRTVFYDMVDLGSADPNPAHSSHVPYIDSDPPGIPYIVNTAVQEGVKEAGGVVGLDGELISSPKVWVNHTVYDDYGRRIREMTPSATDSYTYDLPPTLGEYPEPEYEASEDTGLVYAYAYQDTPEVSSRITEYRLNEGAGAPSDPMVVADLSPGADLDDYTLLERITYGSRPYFDLGEQSSNVYPHLPVSIRSLRVGNPSADVNGDLSDPSQYEERTYSYRYYGWASPTYPRLSEGTFPSIGVSWTWIQSELESEAENGKGASDYVSSFIGIGPHGDTEWLVQERRDGLVRATRIGRNPVIGAIQAVTTNANTPASWWDTSGLGHYTGIDDLLEDASLTGSVHNSDLQRAAAINHDLLGRVVRTEAPGGVATYLLRSMETSTDYEPGLYRFTLSLLPHKYVSGPNGYVSYGFNGPAVSSRLDSAGDPLVIESQKLASMTLSTTTGQYAHPVASVSYASGDPLSRSRYHRAFTGLVSAVERWHNTALLSTGSYTTHFNHDALGRLRVTRNSEGAVRRYSYDVLNRLTELENGSDIVPASSEDGSDYLDQDEATGLVRIAEYEYDDGAIGNSNLTSVSLLEDSSISRTTEYEYDFRDRLIEVAPPLPPVTRYAYDNLSRMIETEVYDGDPSTSTRGALTRYHYSQRGLLYKTQSAIEPALETPSEYLEHHRWYDEAARLRASWSPNGQALKYEYDDLDNVTSVALTDRGGDPFPGASLAYENALGYDSDVVFEETQYTYTEDDFLPELTTVLRRDPALADTVKGKLSDITGADAELVLSSFTSQFYDEANNLIRIVDHGTNLPNSEIFEAHPQANFQASSGYYPVIDPSTPPTSHPLSVSPAHWRISEFHYDPRGVLSYTADPDYVITQYLYDDLTRTIATIEGVDGAGNQFPGSLVWDGTDERWSVSGVSYLPDDQNRVTSFAYDGLSRVVKRVAHILTDAIESVQETEYVYGVSTSGALPTSSIDSPNLLREVVFPDPTTGLANPSLPTRRYAYNRLGELIHSIDENGTEHALTRDALGRVTSDSATIDVASDIDDTVGELTYVYDDFGRLHRATSLASVGGILNQIEHEYDSLWRLEKLHQRVSGPVRTGGGALQAATKTVAYDFADTEGASASATLHHGNLNRLSSITYPTAYVDSKAPGVSIDTLLERDYGATTTAANRVSLTKELLLDGKAVTYDWLGVSIPVRVAYVEPAFQLDRAVWLEGSSPAQGDSVPGRYPGLDPYTRVRVDAWVDTALMAHGMDDTVPSVPPIYAKQYTYTHASDLTAVDDIRPAPIDKQRDRRLSYDGLHRLSEDLRGAASGPGTAIATHSSVEGASGQAWTLDTLGNWASFGIDADANGAFAALTEVSTRAHDFRNQIKDLTPQSGATPLGFSNDDAGNLSTREVQADGHVVTHHYIHDAWDRLVGIDISDRQVGGQTCSTPQRAVEQQYNALNHRTTKKVYELSQADCVTPPTLAATHEYYYDSAWRLLEEHVDPDALTSNDHTVTQYFWGERYIDDALMRRRLNATEHQGSTVLLADANEYYATDRQFSVVARLAPSPSAAAALLERVSYTAYGEPRQRPLGDIDGDGLAEVGGSGDLSHLLAAWGDIDGVSYRSSADLNRDGKVDSTDMSILFAENTKASAAGELSLDENIVGYAGYLFDAELAPSRYTVRHRSYVPGLGRWAERDPLLYYDGGNAFEYVRSQSMRFVDPSGEAWYDTQLSNWVGDRFVPSKSIDELANPDAAERRKSHFSQKWRASQLRNRGSEKYNFRDRDYGNSDAEANIVHKMQEDVDFIDAAKERGAAACKDAMYGAAMTPLALSKLKNVGRAGKGKQVREVVGNADDAKKLFDEIRSGAAVTEVAEGVFTAPGPYGGTLTYRAVSQSGPPTIDTHGVVEGLRKIKFVEQ